MSVNSIENNNTKRVSYVGSMAVGAMAGYALKWAIPLTSQEKDGSYKQNMSEARHTYWQKREQEIEALKNIKEKPDGADEFIKLHDEKRLTYTEIKKAEQPLQDKLLGLLNKVNDSARTSKKESREAFVLHTKKMRPASTFIILGIVTGLLYALIYNVDHYRPQED